MIDTMLIAAAVLGSSPAAAAPQLPPREVVIPFAARGGIRDWESEGDRSILLRDRTNKWYRATFLGTCPRLNQSSTLVFNTDASGTFDRFSTIRTVYGVCSIDSIVRAAAPRSHGGK